MSDWVLIALIIAGAWLIVSLLFLVLWVWIMHDFKDH